MPREFLKTGIKGLDTILGGGIPRGNVTLVTGGPGTGKTVLGIEFVYRGARQLGEPGLIVTFEMSTERLIEDALSLGWHLHELQDQGKLKIVSTTRSVFRQEVEQADTLLISEAKEIGARRIFIDGLAAGALNGNGTPPVDVFRMLIEGLHHEGLTAMFALDASVAQAATGTLPEEFIADTIIKLGRITAERHASRTIEIVKSRGHGYMMGEHSFRIVDGQGLEVYQRVQMPRSSVRAPGSSPGAATRTTTGIEGLDGLLNGGYLTGSSTLVVGISGTGKSVMGLQFLAEGARRGERGLMVTLDEPAAQVLRNARSIGIDLAAEMDRGMIRLWSEPAQEIEIDQHFVALEEMIASFEPRRVVIDSLSSYAATIGSQESFRDFVLAIIALMRQRDITAVYNHESPELLGLSSMMGNLRVSSLMDNIIMMNWVELGDRFRHALTLAKARAMPTNRVTHECEIIDGRGLVVLPRQIHMALPVLPFASYYGLLSRAPERRSPPPAEGQ